MSNTYHHPRSKRLAVVLNLAKQSEQQALQRWASIQERLKAEQAKSSQLEDYKKDYQDYLSTPVEAVIKAGNIHNTVDFIRQIEGALKQQLESIKEFEGQAEVARNAYLECRKKTEMLSKMVNRLEEEYFQEQSRKEQKELEEWNNAKR